MRPISSHLDLQTILVHKRFTKWAKKRAFSNSCGSTWKIYQEHYLKQNTYLTTHADFTTKQVYIYYCT